MTTILDTPGEYPGNGGANDAMITWVELPVTPPAQGTMVPVDLEGTSIVLAAVDGSLVAFDDECSHRACPLSEGMLDGGSVVCPCHRSRFDLKSGVPLNGPATEPIRLRAVRSEGGRLLVER